LIASPLALVVGVRATDAISGPAIGAGPTPQGQLLGALLIGALFALGTALFFGLVLFGLYAYAGGFALERLRVRPLAGRIAVGIFAVAIVQTTLQVLVTAFLGDVLTTPGRPPVATNARDWSVHMAMAAGWVLGLWVDPGTERALNTVQS
jgi:hypothetical protein